MNSRNGQLHDLDELQISSLSKKAAHLARQNGHSEAVAVAMVDPEAEVIEAKDANTGASRLVLRSDIEADRGRYQAGRFARSAAMCSRSPPKSRRPTGWAAWSPISRKSRASTDCGASRFASMGRDGSIRW